MVSPLTRKRRDAFASFLASRPEPLASTIKLPSVDLRKSSSTGGLRFRGQSDVADALQALQQSGALRPERQGGAAVDPFAAFNSLRPEQLAHQPESEEAALREELLKAKRHLLELALQAEQRALDPSEDPETLARLRNVKKARSYLRHPEWTLEPLSRAESKQDAEEEAASSAADIFGEGEEATGEVTRLEVTQLEPPQEEPQEEEAAAAMQRSRQDPKGFLASRAASAPTLCPPINTSCFNTHQSGWFSLPPLSTTSTLSKKVRMSPKVSDNIATEPLTAWAKPQSWNLGVSKNLHTARRKSVAMPGGCVVLGNGCIPLYTAMRFPRKGYYYAFQIEALDTSPSAGKAMTLGFGISRLPPDDGRCMKRQYGYEISGSVLLGYGGRLIDSGKWRRTNWNPSLKTGDIVGLLVTLDGELVVYINDEQALRVPCSLSQKGILGETLYRSSRMDADKRRLYPLLDLSGYITAVTLLPTAKPPNVELGPLDEVVD